jgi:hypothetical protein
MDHHVTCLVTVKLLLGLIIKHHAIKTYGGVEYISIALELGTKWK